MEKETLTVIHQGDSYLFKTGGYNTHLAIDGKHFAKTSDLQIGYCPKKVEIGTDKHEVDFYTREVEGKEEKITAEQYQDMSALMREECMDEDGDRYISLEHEYKYRKAMNGWQATMKDWVEWKEFPFQVLELLQTNNPLITGYLSDKRLDNPLVVYHRNPNTLFIDAMKRLGITEYSETKNWDGVPKKVTYYTGYGTVISRAQYDSERIFDNDWFKYGTDQQLSYDKALEAYEADIERIVKEYHRAYAKVHAQITEDNGRKLAETLFSIERQLNQLPVYAKSSSDKKALLITIKNAKALLGVE